MGKQDEQLLKNIEEYEQKNQLTEKPVTKKKLMCEVKGVKVYGLWY